MQQDDTTLARFGAVHKRIHDAVRADHDARWMQTVGGFTGRRVPVQGMYVITGPHGGSVLGSIGWVVQVRLKQGQFGSDIYILCQADNGPRLMQHSNNVFYPLTPDEVELVRPFFAKRLPEHEDFSRGYSLGSEETRAVGFLIDPPEGFEPRGGEGARLKMTTIGADGSKTITDTVFL
jgi:hypothetical protein